MTTKAEILVKIDEAIADILDAKAVKGYSINGRSVERYSLKELQDLRDSYKRDIALESAKRSSVVRFNEPE